VVGQRTFGICGVEMWWGWVWLEKLIFGGGDGG
jgi:hypothetical protein